MECMERWRDSSCSRGRRGLSWHNRSINIVPSNDQSGQPEPIQRSLLDLTPIQHPREVLTPATLERRAAPTPPKHYVEAMQTPYWQRSQSSDGQDLHPVFAGQAEGGQAPPRAAKATETVMKATPPKFNLPFLTSLVATGGNGSQLEKIMLLPNLQ